MRIAFVTTEYMCEKSEFDGGLSNYLYRQSKSLVKRGHDIEIFTLSDNSETFKHDDILTHQVRNNSKLFLTLSKITRYKLKRVFRFLSIALCLSNFLKKRHIIKPFDIIQVCSCFGCGLFITKQFNIPVLTRVSSYEPLLRKYYRVKLNLDQKLCELIEKFALKRSCAVFAPSNLLANILNNINIKTDVMRPPFTLEHIALDENVFQKHLFGKNYLLFYGAIGYLKGCAVLADCLPEIFAKYPDIHLALIGKNLQGPEGLNMVEYIQKISSKYVDRIHYLGILDHSKLYPILENSHTVVLPSLIDNLPNTMIESMAMGKVVIGTRGTSFEELIEDGRTGLLVEKENSKALFDAIDRALNLSEEKRKEIGLNAKSLINLELNPEIICKKLENYYENLITKYSS
ncbi:MAG: hypothetical protein A2Y03_04275 [Omnitrophica WOR_2 bacterium GWF2_38_59]|nr:MAG: hypothetical protein A2Y03_04275 [Omnitrophica WOR_2 bacterium GWF2_38_59]OGX53527.1 MAG: hypothetical protein A2267_09375 [Omnitrophica WOR_2 bacterium RIFOXYA12_FULL_38_10]OGX55273.1 MAG: hypothetical protein A2447_01535 [Omnitrophica WOR_2 bacterium RIFOXYC2_FULL_38_12]